MNKKRYIIGITIVLIIGVIVFFGLGGILSQRTEIEEFNLQVTENGTEITIVQISDLHVPKSGIAINELVSHINNINPDLIVLTGDIIDSQALKEDVDTLKPLLNYIGQKAKSYAILGNHEAINMHLDNYKQMLSSSNIHLLDNAYDTIQIKDKTLTIAGIVDNGIYTKQTVPGLNTIDQNSPVILLAHRPEFFHEYISLEYSSPVLTLAGHAHGGQFRIFGKGIYSPNQGYLPKYCDGLYQENGKYMVVSRGLGDSIFPLRIYNRYHLPVIKITL